MGKCLYAKDRQTGARLTLRANRQSKLQQCYLFISYTYSVHIALKGEICEVI